MFEAPKESLLISSGVIMALRSVHTHGRGPSLGINNYNSNSHEARWPNLTSSESADGEPSVHCAAVSIFFVYV